MGNSQLRKALYMPAVVAKSYNPIIMTFCERLLKSGLRPMAVIGAAMHKLLHLIYGVLKSGKPFDPDYLQKQGVASWLSRQHLRNGIILTIQAVCALRYEGIHTLFWFSIYCLIISRGAPPTVEMKYELVHNVGKRVRRLLYSCRNSLELRPLMNRTNKCTPYCGCISQSKWTWSGTLAPHASAGVISISMISTCFSADVSQIIFSNLTATSSTNTLRRYFGYQTIGYLQE